MKLEVEFGREIKIYVDGKPFIFSEWFLVHLSSHAWVQSYSCLLVIRDRRNISLTVVNNTFSL